MKLSEFKNLLPTLSELNFKLEDGTPITAHFHITEVGEIQKKYIDCGGTLRAETAICMQLWESVDVWHRLAPSKLLNIIHLSEEKLGISDSEIEIEYQSSTIGRYGLSYADGSFTLTAKTTTCLASDACGVTPEKISLKVKEMATSCCTPGSGCC